MNDFHRFRPSACAVKISPRIPLLLGLLFFLCGSPALWSQTSMSEYQVKALFLLNFAKYVDWAPMAAPGTAFVIDVLGQNNLADDLRNAAEGKSIGGRPIVIRHISSVDELGGCSILFVSSSENSQLPKILGKASTMPILTVGEDGSFLQKGGIINFTLRDGKIHLQINLKAARQVNLAISSKLLSVADTVME
jgi:hypothetical protein